MPLENKAGDVCVNDQSCRCDRRRGQYGAAHRCGGRTPRIPPADYRYGSTAWQTIHLDHHLTLLPGLTLLADSGGGGRGGRRQMPKLRKKKRSPKRVLALPDLEQSKTAVLNSLTSKSGQRSYDHAITDFVEWYRSEPRLAFNRTVVLRYRIYLEQKLYAPTTINL